MPGIAFAGGAFPEQIGADDVVEAAAVVVAEEPSEAPEAPAEVVIHEEPKDVGARKRARHPKGSDKGGEFVGDDPLTPENEAFEADGGSPKG